jgi:hypothetical protein
MILACPALRSSERPGKLQVTPADGIFDTHRVGTATASRS